MKTKSDTMEDILTYLYCTADTLALIRNELDIGTSQTLCVDAFHGEIHHLRQLCKQLGEHIQKIPDEMLQQIAKAVAGKEENKNDQSFQQSGNALCR